MTHSGKRHTIFYCSPNKTTFKEYKKISSLLCEEYDAFFFVSHKLSEADKRFLKTNGFQFLSDVGESYGQTKNINQRKLLLNKLKSLVKNFLFGKRHINVIDSFASLMEKQLALNSLASKNRIILQALENRAPYLIVLPSDRQFHGFELLLLNSRAYQEIPKLIIFTAYPANGSSLEALRKNSQHNVTNRPKFVELFPKQVRRESTEKMLISYYSQGCTLALKQTKLLPELPWVVGKSSCCKILVQDEFQRDFLCKNGVHEKRILHFGNRFSGQKNLTRTEICRRYFLDAEKPIAVVALPQHIEDSVFSREEAYKFVIDVLKGLQLLEANILISLHPKMDRENYQFIKDDFQLKIAKEDLEDIIATADVFFSSYSSTLLWAYQLEIPFYILDFLNEKLTVFDHLPHLKVLESPEELSDLKLKKRPMHKLNINRDNYFQSVKELFASYNSYKKNN